MGLFSENKCTRCDRRYSGLRGKCPYCGARKSKRSKKTADSDKVGWKLITGIVLMVILILAVVAILFVSLRSNSSDSASSDTSAADTTDSTDSAYKEDEGVTSIDDDTPQAPPSDSSDTTGTAGDASNPADNSTAPATDDQEPSVTSVVITYLGDSVSDVTLNVGELLALGCETTPADVSVEPEWSCEDSSIASILPTGELTAIASGTTTITVTVGSATAECIVRVS